MVRTRFISVINVSKRMSNTVSAYVSDKRKIVTDMSFSLSATLLITAQNCNASIEHQAVIYPGGYSTHKSKEFEIVMDRFE